MIRKTVRLMLYILFSIAIVAACGKTTEIGTLPPPPTDTQVPATKTPLKPTATQVPATKTLPPPTATSAIPTQTLEPSPTTSSINELPMTERVSVSNDGTQGNSGSYAPAISSDGRYVAFTSDASNLVVGDTNGVKDIFVHDRKTGQTQLVSIASDGTQGNSNSYEIPAISADGRYVAFKSEADNLVEGDTNGVMDCFVHDRVTGETTRVSVASDGKQSNGKCGNIGWWTYFGPSISADGRYVVFYSEASNLVEGDTDGVIDIFVHDRGTGETTLESISSDGTQGNGDSLFPSISSDGRYVAFQSEATNMVEGDTNGGADCFMHDRVTGETTLASVSSDGTQGNSISWYPTISADGRYVVFNSLSDNLVESDTNGILDIFVHDRVTGETTLESVSSDGTQENNAAHFSSISADGRYVLFESEATNLVEGDTNEGADCFVHDRGAGKTALVPVSSDGIQENENSGDCSISADGRHVAFSTWSTNLVMGDTNGTIDVFVRDLGTGK